MSVTFHIETTAQNGVRVITCRRSQHEFETAAIFRGRLLNLLTAPNPIHAGKMHRLLFEAWSKASEANLLDESQNAARFVEHAPLADEKA
jgi:ribosome biogenesis protein Tsr3